MYFAAQMSRRSLANMLQNFASQVLRSGKIGTILRTIPKICFEKKKQEKSWNSLKVPKRNDCIKKFTCSLVLVKVKMFKESSQTVVSTVIFVYPIGSFRDF